MDPRNEAPQVTSLISSKSLLLPVVVGVYDLKRTGEQHIHHVAELETVL
jgi:hypothetical protein